MRQLILGVLLIMAVSATGQINKDTSRAERLAFYYEKCTEALEDSLNLYEDNQILYRKFLKRQNRYSDSTSKYIGIWIRESYKQTKRLRQQFDSLLKLQQ